MDDQANTPQGNQTENVKEPAANIDSSSTSSTVQGTSQTPPLNDDSKVDSTGPSDITSDEIATLKEETIQYAKAYAKTGQSTRKEPSPNLANDHGPYYWWEKQATYESNTWSVSLWEYDNQSWQLQATKVELNSDGHSRMTAYSMRKDTDQSFPGFQIYKEQKDDRYHPAAIEDIVYLNRVLKGLVNLSNAQT